MSVRDLEPDGSPPGCSLLDLATSSAGEVPSVTLGCCHLAGAQISPQVEQGFGLLSSQIKAVSRASGRELGLQMSISDMPHHSPGSFVSCPPANASLFLSKSSPREGAAPKQLCEGRGGNTKEAGISLAGLDRKELSKYWSQGLWEYAQLLELGVCYQPQTCLIPLLGTGLSQRESQKHFLSA